MLTGNQNLPVAGLSLQNAEFTLENGKGLTFKNAAFSKHFFDSTVSGTVSPNGEIQFSGTDSSGELGPFPLSSITASGTLNTPGKPSTMLLSASTNLTVASGVFKASVTTDSSAWPSPVLSLTTSVEGALSKLLSGNAKFEISADGMSVSREISACR